MNALRWAAASGCALFLTAAIAGAANAQQIDPSITFNPNNTLSSSFDRGENISVRERPRPEYQAAGIHLGGFMLFPKLTSSFTYDDNIYALHTHAIGDEIFTVNPELDLQSTWSRNSLAAYVRLQQDWYMQHSSEDATQYGAGIDGKYEFGHSTLTAGVDYGHYALPRTAANVVNGSTSSIATLSKHRITYDYTAANVELAHTFNRLRLSARADYQLYSYQNGLTPGGIPVIEVGQNHNVETYTGKAEYAVSPDTALFVIGAYNQRYYDIQPPDPRVTLDRNSTGYNVGGGINFDLTHLVRGEVQVGYLDQEYASPLLKPIKGVSAKGQIEWFPSQLTTVTATVNRDVGDSGIIGSAGFLATNGGIQIDHELMRNVILTANATVGQDQYQGISRTDDLWGAGVSANWLLNRAVGITFAYAHLNQSSHGADRGPSFGDNRLTVSLVLQR